MAALHRFANQAVTYLASGINGSATSVSVVSAALFPPAPFEVTCGSEVMRVTAVDGNTLTVIRGQEGTTATSHSSGDPLAHTVTRDGLLDSLANNGVNNAALSFSSTDPEAPGASTVYLTPLAGNNIALYDALEQRWRRFPITIPPSVSADEAAGTCVDVFASWDNAAQAVVLNKVTFDCEDGRPNGYDLVRVDGVVVSESATGWRHVGTYQMVSNSQVALNSNTPILSGYQNNEVPRLGKKILRIDPPITSYEIHGVEPAEDGATVYLLNVSDTDTILIKHNSGTAGANAKILALDADDYPIYPLGGVTLIYDASAAAYRVIGACCATTTAAPTTTVAPTTTTTTAGPGTTTTTAAPTTTAGPTTTTADPYSASCLPATVWVRVSTDTNGVSGPHFEFSNDNSSWYVITSASPKLVANRTYTFKLTNTSSHPFRVFDSDGFNRLVKAASGGASGTVADGFWGGDVTLTVVLFDKAPFSYDCGLHGFEGGIGENAIAYGGDCSVCAQPVMYLRLNEDPATYPPPPTWPIGVPVVQHDKGVYPYDSIFVGTHSTGFLGSRSLQVTGLTGQIAGIKVKIYGFRSTIASANNKCVVFFRHGGTGQKCLIAGELDASGTDVAGGVDYVITHDPTLSAWSFGAAGTYKPNPNGKLSTSYSGGDTLPYPELSDLIGETPNAYYDLLVWASADSGTGDVTIESLAVEILTTNGETRTFWKRPNNEVGQNGIDAHGVAADIPLPATIANAISETPGTLGVGEVKYVRFRSEYDANYSLWAGGQGVGGVKLEIFRSWDGSGTAAATYFNLYDTSRKRLLCSSGEFITFKFTNTSSSSKSISLKLQTPGVHYEMSADGINWHLANRWTFGGAGTTTPAWYKIDLRYLTNPRFAIRTRPDPNPGSSLPYNTGFADFQGITITSLGSYFVCGRTSYPENSWVKVMMGYGQPTQRFIDTLTGTLTINEDEYDDDRQSLVYGAGCAGVTDPPTTTGGPTTTGSPTTTGAPWVAGYYCVYDLIDESRYCSYISTTPPDNPNVTYSGPYANLYGCYSLCLGVTTTTTAGPTTTGGPTTTAGGTTTLFPCTGRCLYTWNGTSWDVATDPLYPCSAGCECDPPPVGVSGPYVGYTGTGGCRPTTTTTAAPTTTAGPTTTSSTTTTAVPGSTTTAAPGSTTTSAPATTTCSPSAGSILYSAYFDGFEYSWQYSSGSCMPGYISPAPDGTPGGLGETKVVCCIPFGSSTTTTSSGSTTTASPTTTTTTTSPGSTTDSPTTGMPG